jgi:hypothetical protein
VSQINRDNLNSIGIEAPRHYMNKKREYVKDKIHEIATNDKNIKNLCRDLN